MTQQTIINRWNKFVGAMFEKGWCVFDVRNKENSVFQHILYMLNRTQRMFRYDGLPDTIPARDLELVLQTNGSAVFYRYNGDLYAFRAGLGGEPNEYYQPTIATIANPALRLNVNARIGEDCVLMRDDSVMIGLVPLFSRYATQMAETELSINVASINSRIVQLIAAPDDNTKTSAEKLMQDVEDGKLSVIADFNILDGLKTMPYATNSTRFITELIELEQYLKASWFNEIGLNANYNMKRESLNATESQMNNDALLPLIDDMLECRKEALEKVNDMFGTNISVSLSSSWEDNQEEIDLEHEAIDEEPTVETQTAEVSEDEKAV